MTKTLEMTFRTTGGKEVVMSLPEPKDGLTLAQVQTVMQSIITKNLFNTKSGDLSPDCGCQNPCSGRNGACLGGI